MADPILECRKCKAPVRGELSETGEWTYYWFRCMKCGRKWTKLKLGGKGGDTAK